MSKKSKEREVLEELYRLYKWRFEIGAEETGASNADYLAMSMEDFKFAENLQKQVDGKLRQYGREKKAAWQRVAEILEEPENEEECCVKNGVAQLLGFDFEEDGSTVVRLGCDKHE